jgi:predicted Rdx family selenoprotein
MPWPGQIGLLLAEAQGLPSQALRWGLRALRASLQAALEEAPDDPGSEALRGLLAELDSLLEGTKPSPGFVLPPDGTPDDLPVAGDPSAQAAGREDGSPPSSPRLLSLARAVSADPRLRAELDRSPLREGSDEEIWNDVQRLLLRVAPGLADEWRRRGLEQAGQVGGRPDEGHTARVPLGRDEVIYQGLSGAVRATGLRSAAGAAMDPRVGAPTDGGLRHLAGILSTCLWFIEHDPHLCHCLKNVFRFGVSPLTGNQRERYVAELLRLWERVRDGGGPSAAASRQGLKDRMKERLDLDEALHSLVYQPPAAPDSWWGWLQGQARDTLFQARDHAAAAGCPVQLQLLGGSFADINRLAPDSLQVDYGVPGEVSTCLRVWARVDGEELKGRVLYRSPQEGT